MNGTESGTSVSVGHVVDSSRFMSDCCQPINENVGSRSKRYYTPKHPCAAATLGQYNELSAGLLTLAMLASTLAAMNRWG